MAKFRYLFIFLFFVLISASISDSCAQRNYVIYLSDKSNTSFDLANPLTMISQRALDRRNRQNIAMDSTDIPVNPSYVSQISATGALVIRKSKWFNAVAVDCDSVILQQILNLPFVINQQRILKVKQPSRDFPTYPAELDKLSHAKVKGLDYGFATNQIRMLGADLMHDDGFNGAGMWIGVFDSGFRNADSISAFDDLINSNRLLGTYDIVDSDSSVFEDHTHGTSVLSCMTAFSPGEIIGTAYGASYILFRTENVFSETQLEEFNWLVAAEKADSMGVDIINTSLGYSTMDNPLLSHAYSDMDGKTTIIARSATIAARKGMLCVTSAGNEGNGPWFYITSPADADSIITVGAVTSDSLLASFSGRGPSFDGRIKPNVVAQGQSSAIISANSGTVIFGSGTSFSGPIMAGFAAGIWQANPNLSNIELIDLIQRASDRYSSPNNEFGYGIPNYGKIKFLTGFRDGLVDDNNFAFFPNPINDPSQFYLRVNEKMYRQKIKLQFYNALGHDLGSLEIIPDQAETKVIHPFSFKKSGMIFINVTSDYGSEIFKIVKN